jgi:hypothetical protein
MDELNRHVTGETSKVRLQLAGMGMGRIRIANLPPEVPERTLRVALVTYVEIRSIHDETWSKAYRYTVENGIKVAMMKLSKHLPSHMAIAGNRILASYEGRTVTRYGCRNTGHMYQSCPNGREAGQIHQTPPTARGPRSLQKDIPTDMTMKRVERSMQTPMPQLNRQREVHLWQSTQ